MRFEIFTVIIMKTAVFWDVTLCSLVIVTNILEELPASIFICPEDGDGRFLQNVCNLPSGCMMSHPRRLALL
jgi:hypothetical protein